MKSVTKAWMFLSLLSITLIVLGHHYGGREGLLIALVLTLSINSFIYFYEDRRVLAKLGGHELEGQESYNLHERARRLAVRARVPTPRIVLLAHASPQAGVVGRGITHGTIILTEGLLKKFSYAEVEAIMAYQIACIASLNTLAFAVGSFIASVFLFITETLDLFLRILIVEKKNPQTYISQAFTRLCAPLIGLTLKLSIRPSFYSSADQLASQLISDPKTLARALWKLQSYAETLPFHPPESTAHMFIVTPLPRSSWSRWLITHPQPEERIRNLIGYYPI